MPNQKQFLDNKSGRAELLTDKSERNQTLVNKDVADGSLHAVRPWKDAGAKQKHFFTQLPLIAVIVVEERQRVIKKSGFYALVNTEANRSM